MEFEYQAIDGDGAVVRGIIRAQSPQKVMQILLHLDLHPLEIQPLTETTVELSRLNQLRKRLEGKPEVEPQPKPVERKEPRPQKSKFDWTYVVFLLLMVGLVVAAALTI